MVFSLNKKIAGKSRLTQAMVLTAALSLTAFVSGCTEQKATPGHQNAALLSQTVVDPRVVQEDFAFPSQTPSLMQGREVYQQQCVKCHATSFWQTPKVKTDIAYTTPIDFYLMLTTGTSPKVIMPTPQRHQLAIAGGQNHPAFREKMDRDSRWAVIFYSRYLAGAGDIHSPDPKVDMAAIFGGNCAVCHGSKAQGDGPLYTAKTGNHELHDGVQLRNFMPAPANFQQYNRVYNRTDAQLMKYICEGIYPSAMPSWYGDVNVDKDTGKITYIFDEKMITNMVRYVRTWAYKNDLASELPEAKTPPPGLEAISHCNPVPNNRPWTNAMRNNGPNKGSTIVFPLANPITGGMTHVGGPTTLHPTVTSSSAASKETKEAAASPAPHPVTTGGKTAP